MKTVFCKSRRRNNYNKQSLRVFFSGSAVRTMCLSCVIACLIVCGGVIVFYRGEYTVHFVVGMCFLVCVLAAVIGTHLLLHVAETFIKPIEKVNEAVKKVTGGDFTVNIEVEDGKNAIDEFVTLEQNFNQMTAELLGMDYMRKDFMSNVSHEIKTPIAAIMGFTEILQGDHLPEKEKREYLQLVEHEARRLSRLCENMLRMSRLDTQKIVTRKEMVDIAEQIRKAAILLGEKWEHKEQELDIELEEIEVESDPDLLMQVWINLIDNALKYSPEKSVVYIRNKVNRNHIEITIQDEGIGILDEKQEYIFDKFYQCEESHKRQGNGLGLSIVKRIIELLDGKIECESKPGILILQKRFHG